MASNMDPHVLLINLPMQNQVQLVAPTLAIAEKWLEDGLAGLIDCKQKDARMVVSTVKGTAYCIISEDELKRRVGQHQLLMTGQPQPRGH